MRLSLRDSAKRCGARAGFEPAVRSNIAFECRTGDSRAYSRPAPASRGPGYTTRARARSLYPGQSRYAKVTKLKPLGDTPFTSRSFPFPRIFETLHFSPIPPRRFAANFPHRRLTSLLKNLRPSFVIRFLTVGTKSSFPV